MPDTSLPDSCFAYVPADAKGADGAKSKRKLKLCGDDGELSAAIIGAAAAALGKGYRGEKVDLPAGERDAVIAKVRAAWKKVNPDKDADEMPDVLKATEPLVMADPDEKPGRDYLAAMKAKLKELLGVSISEEDWNAAHKHAVSSAGGKGKAKKRKQDAAAYREHAERHPELVEGCEYCYDAYEIQKLPKADTRVRYRAGAANDNCYSCRFYRWGSCNLVEGAIEAEDVCDLRLPPVKTYPETPMLYAAASPDGGSWSLFVEQQFADAPDWINVLPKPGVYSHPSYGKIAISAERNQRFINNFDSKIYQENLPLTLDLEHKSEVSGSVGYFDAMRLNADGSVDAKVSWTDRGKELIEADAFKYFSPAWLEVWYDPLTGERYEDVLIGGAACTRPFFKESALRPLVASEAGLAVGSFPTSDQTIIWMQPLAALSKEDRVSDAMQFTEEEVKEFRELKAKDAEREKQFAAQAEEVKQLKLAQRKSKFTDLVRGRGGENDGAPWVGDPKENVAELVAMAEAVGEESDVFKAYVARQISNAKTLKESGAFAPIGTTESGKDESAWDRIEAKAKTYSEEKGVTHAAAVKHILETDKGLANEYARER